MDDFTRGLCKKIGAYADSPILHAMIESTARDGVERGCEFQYHEDGSVGIGNICSGSECSVRIPHSAKRVGTFHTHPGVYEDKAVTPFEVFSLGDLMEALWHEEDMLCVGQLHNTPRGQETRILCSCLDTQILKAKLIEALVKE